MNKHPANWLKANPLLGCALPAFIIIAVADLLSTNSFAPSVDSFLQTIGSAIDSFSEFARQTAWRPWFYLLGTVGFAMSCRAGKAGDEIKAVKFICGTLLLGLISFVALDKADPGRVHRYSAWLTMAIVVCSVLLGGAVAYAKSCRGKAWEEVDEDTIIGLLGMGTIGTIGMIIALIASFSFQTRIAEMADISEQVEAKYGQELRAMQFEAFYNDHNGSTWRYEEWSKVFIGGESKTIEKPFNLDNPDDNERYLVKAGFSFEIGMIDNKPVVMIGSIDWKEHPRDQVMRSVDRAVEAAMGIIRASYKQLESERANENGWRERLFKPENKT